MLHAHLERLDQAPGREIAGREHAAGERHPLTLGGRLHDHRRIGEDRAAPRVHALDAGELQPELPAAVVVVVEEHVVAEVLRTLQRVGAVQELRTADRHHALAEQPVGPQTRIAAAPHADADVDVVAREIHEFRGCADPQIEIRVSGAEATEPGQEPFGGERREHADRQVAARADRCEPGGRGGDLIEGLAHRRQVALGLLGQQEPTRQAPEQPHPQAFLEALDLMADRGLGHVQLVRCTGEAQMARRCLEGAQRVERRQTPAHRPTG